MVSIIGKTVQRNDIHRILGIISNIQDKSHRFTRSNNRLICRFRETDRIIFTDQDAHFRHVSIFHRKLSFCLVFTPDFNLIIQLLIIFDIHFFISADTDLTGIIDWLEIRYFLFCDIYLFQRPS